MPFIPLDQPEQPRHGFTPIAGQQDQQPKRGFTPLAEPKPDWSTVVDESLGSPVAIGEAAANLGSQMVALPVAGVAGLGAAAGKALGHTDAQPADVVRHVGSALTYEPKTEGGQKLTEAASLPFELLNKAGQKAGDATLDATGSPAAAAAVDTAINALPMVAAPAAKAAGFTPSVALESADSVKAPVDIGAHEASTSPNNSLPEPSEAQKKAGNYTKGHVRIAGLDISVENPEGSARSGTDANGKPWSVTMQSHYGYFLGTVGKDKEHMDVFVRPGTGQDYAGPVFVVDQKNPGNGHFDEHKVMLGFKDRQAALDAYLANYEPGWKGAGPITEMAMPTFKAWIDSADHSKPAAETAPIARADRQWREGISDVGATARDNETPEPQQAHYALIEADDLKPSRDSTSRPSEAIKAVQAIQSKFDPTRLAESPDAATGAPVVNASGIVEAGNNRVNALKRVYIADGQKAEDYRNYLRDNSEQFGLSPNAVDSMQKPVLVRVPATNTEAGAQNASEHAMAGNTTLDAFAPGANYAPLMEDAKLPGAKATTTADLPAPIRREHIIGNFAKALGTTVYEGRVKGKKLGFFRPGNEEVRIKRSNDIEVAAHEVAHLIDDRVPEIANKWRSDKALRDELKSVSYDKQNVQEGFAEAMRLFLTQPAELEARAPKASAWLNDFADTHKYGPALRKAQEAMTGWYGQDALNRARSKIGAEKPLAEFFDRIGDRFRQATVDDLHGIYAMERDLKGDVEPNGPYESARLSRASASIADSAVRYGYPVKKPDGSHTFAGKGLEEILRPVSHNLDDALLYFVGRSARELQTQGREHLFSPSEIDAMLRLRTPEREQAFRDYQKWNRGILDFAEANGVINSQSRAMWQRTEYLPFHRVEQPGQFKGAKPGDWAGVKALTGGTENIRDVLGNIVQNAAQLIDKAVKNEARQKVADLAEKAKGGRFMVKIDPETRPVKVDPKQAADAVLKALGIDRAEWRARGQKLPRFAQKLTKDLENAPDFLEFMVGKPPPRCRGGWRW